MLTYDPDWVQRWWLRDYATQIAADDAERFPALDALLDRLGGAVVETVEVPPTERALELLRSYLDTGTFQLR